VAFFKRFSRPTPCQLPPIIRAAPLGHLAIALVPPTAMRPRSVAVYVLEG